MVGISKRGLAKIYSMQNGAFVMGMYPQKYHSKLLADAVWVVIKDRLEPCFFK